jgi:hypothetical protein
VRENHTLCNYFTGLDDGGAYGDLNTTNHPLLTIAIVGF